MTNSQFENGYTMISHEFLEALTRTRIPGQARQVLDCIIRKTWGWQKKKDEISLSQFQAATGLPKHKIIESRQKLKRMGLIIITEKGNNSRLTYCINEDISKWKPLPKKVTLPKKVISRYPKRYPQKKLLQKKILQKKNTPLSPQGGMMGCRPLKISFCVGINMQLTVFRVLVTLKNFPKLGLS